ncbi:DUF2726 domain-containing protein [Hamadaea flava]|uniref:DUF2726 domain-containing protein n=1 Tax=Hamadaea flava TaxID=1742688 RepID=A0ABV8LR03_9ACTN
MNRYEKVTDHQLSVAAAKYGDRLLAKVRLADVVDVDAWTAGVRRYGLASHLDFVMVTAETSMPKFAVELDGRQHWTDPATRRRDRLKDQLCEWAGLPLLRITSEFIRRQGRWTVLNYAIEAFYLSEGFFEAQEAGHIPMDEPLFATSFLVPTADGSLGLNALDHEARLLLLREYQDLRLPTYAPDVFWTTDPSAGAVQAHAWMAVAPNRYLVARTRVRDCRFQGITPSELAGQLVVLELADHAKKWLAGEAVACDRRTLLCYMGEAQKYISDGGFLGCVTGGALRAGGPPPMTIDIDAQTLGGRSPR